MVITTRWWPVAARISLALANAGFEVAAISPRGSLVRTTRAVSAQFTYRSWKGSQSIERAIRAWTPDLLVCADDQAVDDLHRLYRHAAKNAPRGTAAILKLIEDSLGDPSSFDLAQRKSMQVLHARSLGVRCPHTIVPKPELLEGELVAVDYPIILKADGSWGGMGVRFARDQREARAAMRELTSPVSWPNMMTRLFGGIIRRPFLSSPYHRERTVSLQQYVAGRPANRAVVCWRGKVLAGVSVEAVETLTEFGPATVVKVIDHPEMTSAAEAMVSDLKLSGFIGFDFIHDSEDRAWLIEMNPRVTPTSHLNLADFPSLPSALFLQLTGASSIPSRFPIKDKALALFPQEVLRCDKGEYLVSCYHDVPWEEPKLVHASLDAVLGSGPRSHVRKWLRALLHRLLQGPPPAVTGRTAQLTDHSGSEMKHVVVDQASDVDLSIIVISFNTRDLTLECLRSVVAQTQTTRYEIIVVDNDSDDGSADAIKSEFPDMRLIALKENIGFARANNLAAKYARGRRILLLNPDTVILDHALDRLVTFADENPACRVWGGRTLWGDGSLNHMSCWRRMTLWSQLCFALGLSHLAPNSAIFNAEAYAGWKRDTVRHVDIVTGCLFLIDRNFWEQLGGFDPAFFMYGEEADLCLRALRAGARPIITPSATVIHYGGASERSSVDKMVKLLKGKITIMYRHWSPLARSLGRFLMQFAVLTRWWGYRLGAPLVGRSKADDNAEKWQMIWRRRSEWIKGYATASNALDSI